MRSGGYKPENQTYIADYLALLKLEKQPPSLEFLIQLMEAHIHKVHFDGSHFTLRQYEKYSLKNPEILEGFKQGRGGMCYQANGAFKELLFLLDFKVTLASAKMVRFGRDLLPYAESEQEVHCAILVTLEDNEYLVDVSWGNALRRPLLVGGQLTDVPGEDERQCIKQGELYQVKVKLDDKWELEYEFKNENKNTEEFADNVRFLGTDERSDLKQSLLLIRRLPNDECDYIHQQIYRENQFLLFKHKSQSQGKTITTELTSEAEAKEALRKFGVTEENCEKITKICGYPAVGHF